jgi:hypothetical protein
MTVTEALGYLLILGIVAAPIIVLSIVAMAFITFFVWIIRKK